MTTIVLVHGAWHGGWCWEQLTPFLDEAGLAHVEVELPFTGHLDDVAAVAATLDAIEGEKVLVGHSYGGLVISGAADGREDITHLVYVCAFLVEKGATIFDDLADLPPTKVIDAIERRPNRHTAIKPAMATAAFYASCRHDDAEAAIARLREMDGSSTGHECLGDPWRATPTTYILCERDEAISPEAQRRMATRAGRVVSLDTDHSPFLSVPSETAALVVHAATPYPST